MKITIIGINEITEHVIRYIEDIYENIVIYDIQISADLKNKYKSKNNITIIEHNDIEKDLLSISEKAERLLILTKDDVKNIFFYYKIRNFNDDLKLLVFINDFSLYEIYFEKQINVINQIDLEKENLLTRLNV
jgi:Trk K+ transport system NAD-binding subunit